MKPAADGEAAAGRVRRVFMVVAAVFSAAAFATRGTQSLAYDELFTVWVASRPWSDLIHQANVDGFTPPLFYALVKVVSLAGLNLENLRIIPILFAGLALYSGLSASVLLFGSSVRWLAVLVLGSSAYLFTFAHELRPYSALLACAFVYLGQMGGRGGRSGEVKAGFAALLATAFSYLGVSLVVSWIIECRARVRRIQLVGVGLAALALCAPGLVKIANLAQAARTSQMEWSAAWPVFPEFALGLASLPRPPRAETLGLVLLASMIGLLYRARDQPAFRFLLRTLLAAAATLAGLQAAVRIGFAPRYFAILVSLLLLMAVGLLSRLPHEGAPAAPRSPDANHVRSGRAPWRFGLLIAVAIAGINGIAVVRYLTLPPPPRENWRGALARLEERLGPDGILLAFPFHHAAVAAHAYSPTLTMGGGFASRNDPVHWYEPPARFWGYSFEGLTTLDQPEEVFKRLAAEADLCLLSDEPDPKKTASVFRSFQKLRGSVQFDTGDPRLRAICRGKD